MSEKEKNDGNGWSVRLSHMGVRYFLGNEVAALGAEPRAFTPPRRPRPVIGAPRHDVEPRSYVTGHKVNHASTPLPSLSLAPVVDDAVRCCLCETSQPQERHPSHSWSATLRPGRLHPFNIPVGRLHALRPPLDSSPTASPDRPLSWQLAAANHARIPRRMAKHPD